MKPLRKYVSPIMGGDPIATGVAAPLAFPVSRTCWRIEGFELIAVTGSTAPKRKRPPSKPRKQRCENTVDMFGDLRYKDHIEIAAEIVRHVTRS